MANVTGAWTVTTDWGCDGSITGSFDITFNADGTFTSSGHNGRWFQVECTVVWTYATVANLVYAANVSGSWMAGAQGYPVSGGLKGCFGARRAGIPAAAKAEATAKGGMDPVTGK